MQEMDKDSMLKQLAINAYNVGFGAKKHFATYDIVEKMPNVISLLVLFVGIGQLAYPDNDFNTGISTILILVSILAFTMNSFSADKRKYEETGIELTKIFNELRALYYEINSSHKTAFPEEYQNMIKLLNRYYEISITKQIFSSDWFAHYKFFFQMQIDWIEEQKRFSFWKDIIPKSLVFFTVIMALLIWCWVNIFKG